MSRISKRFAELKKQNRAAFVPFITAGDPDAEATAALLEKLPAAGADLIELGIPFSDPMADGPAIQASSLRALKAGMTLPRVLELVRRFRKKDHATPLVLMGYYNPVLAFGIEQFCQSAAASGVCGLIIPDLPLEEAAPLQQTAQDNGLSLIYLVPPTTPGERVASIVHMAASQRGSFIYCVSLSGVTGERAELPPHLRDFIQRVYGYTKELSLPLAVGFGLSTPSHIAEVTSYADGAVVGSALVRLIEQNPPETQVEAIKTYIQSLQVGRREG